ncbi:MAG TPA: cytochrome c biogenesis protein CcsA [Longimicrobiales bacterium]|nr:cytochrome c biogenesis protein CcsA [Longimicrobiales bacterium]
MIATTLLAIALVLYLGASGTLVASFAGGRGVASRTGAGMTAGAVVLHGLALLAFAWQHGELPLVGLAPSLITLAFLIALFLLATALTAESRPIGLVLVPLIAVLLAVALVLGVVPTGEAVAFRGLWFYLHVVLAFVGYAGLAIAFAAGLLYLLQFRELKDKRLGRIYRFFPSLPVLDELNRKALTIGFPALTLALLLGGAWSARFQPSFGLSEPQVIWGIITWIVFAVLLALRSYQSADVQRRAALGTVLGFVLVVVSYLMLRVFITGGRVFL